MYKKPIECNGLVLKNDRQKQLKTMQFICILEMYLMIGAHEKQADPISFHHLKKGKSYINSNSSMDIFLCLQGGHRNTSFMLLCRPLLTNENVSSYCNKSRNKTNIPLREFII